MKQQELLGRLTTGSTVLAIILAVASLGGLEMGVPLLLLCLGAKEIVSAPGCYQEGRRTLAVVSVAVGVVVAVYAVLSLTHMI